MPCPTLVVRGAASDIVGPDVADRMADDVLDNSGSLADLDMQVEKLHRRYLELAAVM